MTSTAISDQLDEVRLGVLVLLHSMPYQMDLSDVQNEGKVVKFSSFMFSLQLQMELLWVLLLCPLMDVWDY